MDRKSGLSYGLVVLSAALALAGCGNSRPSGAQVEAQEAPPAAEVVPGPDAALVSVDHPEQFQLSTATARDSYSTLAVTAVVNPDIARSVPVVSLASGRVVAIHARLGDTVQKDQVLLSVRSDDVSGGFSDYRKAVADKILRQTTRALDGTLSAWRDCVDRSGSCAGYRGSGQRWIWRHCPTCACSETIRIT